jgi:hypothetical protein
VHTPPQAQRAAADAGTLARPHHQDRAEAADAAVLADPLPAGLAQVM